MPVKYPIAPYLVKIPGTDYTLRADAAASYIRMLAAGMPAGGIDVTARTWAMQQAVYDRYLAGGNLAAKPSTSAPHFVAIAMDFRTSNPKTATYDPSAAFLWATKGIDGSKAPTSLAEKTPMRAFGWRRTVLRTARSKGERWHAAYDPSLDTKANADLDARLKALGYTGLTRAARVRAFQAAHGLTADGKAGPQTWYSLLTSPKPKPAEPAKPKTAQVKILIGNLHDPRFGGPKDSVEQAAYIAKLGADLILCSESRPIDRDDIRAKGRTKLTYPSTAGTVGMIWDGKVFAHGPRLTVDFGDNYHGAVAADLTIRTIGRKLRVISTHTRPKSVATDAKKKADIQKAAALKSGLTLLGGDLAKDKPGSWLTGWRRLTSETLDTMDDKGRQSPDSAWAFGSGIKVVKVELINPGRFSDHRWLLITIEVTA